MSLYAEVTPNLQSVSKRVNSQIDRDSLLLQQKALKKIWDDPEEDLY